MNIETILVADLTPDPGNVRLHPERNIQAITNSLKQFGQQRPILIDKDNRVLAGNGMLQAAKELGWESVECVRTDLEGARAMAYGIADNKTAELAEWDWVGLSEQLRTLRDLDIPILATGFEELEIKNLIGKIDDVIAPEDFKEFGEDIETNCKCPKCGYEWSGS